jgi:hypothetical protein
MEGQEDISAGFASDRQLPRESHRNNDVPALDLIRQEPYHDWQGSLFKKACNDSVIRALSTRRGNDEI